MAKSKAVYVKKSEVKSTLKKLKCNSSSDLFSSLNMLVGWYLEQAAKRAKANRRKTVRGHDFIV